MHVPHLIDLEVASVLRQAVQRGELDDSRASRALADLTDLRAIRYPHAPFLPRIWELRENLTVYDAAYIALAETLDATFVTGDARITRAPGIRCNCDLVDAAPR